MDGLFRRITRRVRIGISGWFIRTPMNLARRSRSRERNKNERESLLPFGEKVRMRGKHHKILTAAFHFSVSPHLNPMTHTIFHGVRLWRAFAFSKFLSLIPNQLKSPKGRGEKRPSKVLLCNTKRNHYAYASANLFNDPILISRPDVLTKALNLGQFRFPRKNEATEVFLLMDFEKVSFL